MTKLGIKSGDQVMIVTGKDKGKSGKVLTADKKNSTVTVQGLNQYKKHVRPTRTSPQGGIVDIDMPVHVSNVMLVCPKCGKNTRVGRKLMGDKLVRTCAKCDQEIV